MYEMDAAVLRNLVLFWALIAGSGLLTGLVPSLVRTAARRNDPSAMAALYGTALTLLSCGYAAMRGSLGLPPGQDVFPLLLTALLTALTWLCLFTVLSGGIVSKALPIVALCYILTAFTQSFFSGVMLGTWQLCAFILVLLGALMIESRVKKLAGQHWMIYAALLAVTCTCLSLLRGIRFSAYDDGLYQLWRTAPACLLLWIFALARGRQRRIPDLPKKALIALPMAALATCGGWLLAGLAAARAPQGITAPLAAITFFFTMLFARTVQKERQPGSAVFGTLLMLVGMTVVALGY